MTDVTGVGRELRTPRAAAVAGIAFALLLSTAIVLMHRAGASVGGDPEAWLSDDARRRSVNLAVGIMPFAGIAFLWFIGVIRTRLGDREDKLFATVFLGSGLLLVAMLFVGSAVLGGLLTLDGLAARAATDTVQLQVAVSQTLLGTFGARMAAVFTLSVTSVGLRTGLVPRWLTVVGYVCSLALLLSPPLTRWSQLLFPAWVLLLSIQILVTSSRSADA